MRREIVDAIRGLMIAEGVDRRRVDLAVDLATGGDWVSVPDVCRLLSVRRWFVHELCASAGVRVRSRRGRCGNLVHYPEFCAAYRRRMGDREVAL